jgi:hypothetical protein
MWLGRILSLGLRTGFGTRLFSTTPAVEAGYKIKSHSGTKKRWKSLASGNSFKRVRNFHKNPMHILTHQSLGQGLSHSLGRFKISGSQEPLVKDNVFNPNTDC